MASLPMSQDLRDERASEYPPKMSKMFFGYQDLDQIWSLVDTEDQGTLLGWRKWRSTVDYQRGKKRVVSLSKSGSCFKATVSNALAEK